MPINGNWQGSFLKRSPCIGLRPHKSSTFTSMKKRCMSCYFQSNSKGQKTSENTAPMCCFLMFDSSLQTKWRKVISKPLKKKIQQLHCLLMIQAIQYKNVALQAPKDVYQDELQKYQDTITHLKTRYVPHPSDPGKDNIIIIVCKHTTPANDKSHDLPYYVARIQRRKRYVKLSWFDWHFPDHEVIVEITQTVFKQQY